MIEVLAGLKTPHGATRLLATVPNILHRRPWKVPGTWPLRSGEFAPALQVVNSFWIVEGLLLSAILLLGPTADMPLEVAERGRIQWQAFSERPTEVVMVRLARGEAVRLNRTVPVSVRRRRAGLESRGH